MNLLEAINNPNSIYSGSVMVIDMTDSTALKEENPEAAWLAIYARAFQCILEVMPEKASLVKHLGDGLVFVFPDGEETNAINTAIKVQERLDRARHQENLSCLTLPH